MKDALHLLVALAAAGLLAAHHCNAADSSPTSLPPDALTKIQFDQKIDAQVSPDLEFTDENGKSVRLGDYFKDKPVILILGYYKCPMLCSLVMNGAIEGLQDIKASVASRFTLVYASIDPRDTPADAREKKETYVKRYGRTDAEGGWHFLTGRREPIHQLADEVGFRYAYDARVQQYAHPSGLVILTPEGRVSRYVFGVTYSAKEIDEALKTAAASKAGSPVQQLILLCFHYSPLKGPYGKLIMTIVRASGIVTFLVLACLIVFAARRRRKGNEGDPLRHFEDRAETDEDDMPGWEGGRSP